MEITANFEEMKYQINMEEKQYDKMEEELKKAIGKQETDDALWIIQNYGIDVRRGGTPREDKIIHTTLKRLAIFWAMWFFMGIFSVFIIQQGIK